MSKEPKDTDTSNESHKRLRILRISILAILNVALLLSLGATIYLGITRELHKSKTVEIDGYRVLYDIEKSKIVSAESQIRLKHPLVSENSTTKDKSTQDVKNNPSLQDTPDNKEKIAKKDPVSIKNKGVIALIIANIGLTSRATDMVSELPKKVGIGLSPYGNNLAELATKFEQSGHEVLMCIPMEPKNYPDDDPGYYGLISSLPDQDNLEKLNMILSKVPNIKAVYSMDNEKFSTHTSSVSPLIAELNKRHLYYVYGGGANNSVIMQTAASFLFPLIVADSIVDNTLTETAISEQINLAIDKANNKGYAVIIARPYPLTINIIKKYLSIFEEKGVELVNLKDLDNVLHSLNTNASKH